MFDFTDVLSESYVSLGVLADFKAETQTAESPLNDKSRLRRRKTVD